ncbi:Multidrug resistance protein [Rhizina undulata]
MSDPEKPALKPITGIDDSDYQAATAEPPRTASDSSSVETLDKAQYESIQAPHNDIEITEEAQHEIEALARKITRNSTHSTDGALVNPFSSSDPELTPGNEKFNVKRWIRAVLRIQSRDPEKYPQRTAGVTYKNLNVHGFGSPLDFQKDVGNVWIDSFGKIANFFRKKNEDGKRGGQRKIQILQNFDGLVRSGEMLIVLGRPGSGCSTLLKTIAGQTHGFYVDEKSEISYQGIPGEIMHKHFRGEVIYNAETDVHFPHLTVGQTLSFAAEARAPRNRMPGVTRKQHAEHVRDVVMAIFGLTHTLNTKVGNDFVRGVSGGERKRVSIAETSVSGSPLQCWDNSTRGLDSATALEFVRTLRLSTDVGGSTAIVAIYQASQDAYDVFDKVVVLYEGRQIYFGATTSAKKFFTDMGFHCPDRQTTADFLTSLTNPIERVIVKGYENRVPRTPDEFAERWKNSEERKRLLRDIDLYNQEFPVGGQQLEIFKQSRAAQQAKRMSVKSPYTISVPMQINLCVRRGFQRLQGDLSNFFATVFGNFIMSLILGSVFYNLPDDTSSFYSRGTLLFYAILMNAFLSGLEILTLYSQRPIVEKHDNYALYHPFAEAVASMICDLPSKILTALSFNLTLYFMTNLRREPGAFFTFFLFGFVCTLTMSMIFRTIASVSRTISQAMPPASIIMLALVIYTGFTIPTRDMVVWFRWINYIDPIAYAFESLMVNEFHGRKFPCAVSIPSGPGYENVSGLERTCNARGAVAGESFVEGTAYLLTSFKYKHDHLWRNLGIIVAFMIFFLFTYILATEKISSAQSKGEVLVFRRSHLPPARSIDDKETGSDGRPVVAANEKSGEVSAAIQKQTDIFMWRDVCYDIKIKGEGRRLLDHVDGWVKPGTLTALMGVSGAGKTTLLDVLASRVTMGVVTGDMLVNGHSRDSSFQRKTGYVQQQDLHLATSTVREALTFSALLRQPKSVSRAEKLAYVDEVIKLLEMEEFSEAVVGVPGEGLNVEQRKRLTIGVELAAKPALLLFLDEPTSGLDSQTAWSICTLLRKLANSGQAILCTIHQPSAMLIQEFDRLLFLARGGRTVYFGELGKNSSTLTSYFERNGAHKCPPDANPAEWMLEVIGAAPGAVSSRDWPQVWKDSPEKQAVRAELDQMQRDLSQLERKDNATIDEFAMPFYYQLYICLQRVFQQYWRTPSYLYSKLALCVVTGLFIGFSFYKANNSQQGLQNQMFAVFMLMTIFGNLVQQIMPHFVTQRSLYEVRERPSKAYSWQAFILANIFVEIPWNSLMSVLTFFSWYYPIGLYRNAIPTDAVTERGGLMFLLMWAFFMFTSTFTHMIIAGIETAETGGNIANLLFSLTLMFCGVLATPEALPGFWIFMYRLSPFTYLVSAMLSTGVANNVVKCSSIELVTFNPPSGQTCLEYMTPYISLAGGELSNPGATEQCQFCSITSTNTFLASVDITYDDRWRNFGLMCVYIIFNLFAAIGIYWLARVPKTPKKTK